VVEFVLRATDGKFADAGNVAVAVNAPLEPAVVQVGNTPN
jgi:hypothetical protein